MLRPASQVLVKSCVKRTDWIVIPRASRGCGDRTWTTVFSPVPYLLLLSLSALWLTACGPFTDAYPGPFRKPSEIAIVSGRAGLIEQPGYEPVYINSVDGEKAIGGWEAPTQEVQILPGTHAIGVVEAKIVHAAESDEAFKIEWDEVKIKWDEVFNAEEEAFKDQAILLFKVVVGARYAIGYNPTTKEFVVVRSGFGPVPFEVAK